MVAQLADELAEELVASRVPGLTAEEMAEQKVVGWAQ